MTERNAVPNPDPCIPLVAAARVFRLMGNLDSAELQLNAAAKVFRESDQLNKSRAYWHESRALYYARYNDNLRYELARAVLMKTGLDMAYASVNMEPEMIHDPITEAVQDYVNDVEIPSGLLLYPVGEASN